MRGSVGIWHYSAVSLVYSHFQQFHNAKERDMSDWAHLLRKAGERFHIVDTMQPPASRLSVMQVRWLAPDIGSVVTGAKEE